ncbi:MAG: LemA family protein [Marinilabiliaceae bacterium]|nr:LemA family protein [Marinilabiliaceae bacterium]
MRYLRIILLALAAVPFLSSCGYNTMVEQSEAVDAQWAQVENVYQRRADLIPNLVATVKGYAEHEQETLTAVIEARAKATSLTLDASNLTEENMAQFQAAQEGLSQALQRLMLVHEQYPDLKANEQFRDLQVQLEGTENRISTERNRFNEAARAYNTTIKKFPTNFIASWFNFEPKAYFKAEEGAQNAPKVEF